MKDNFIINFLGSGSFLFGFALMISFMAGDHSILPVFLIGVILVFIGITILANAESITATNTLKHYLKNMDTKKMYEENLKRTRGSSETYDTYNDLLGVILLSIQRDQVRLPVFQEMYKNNRGAERLRKSNAYLLSYLIENRVKEFIKEYKHIRVVKNYVLEKGIGYQRRDEDQKIFHVDDTLVDIFYDAYENSKEIKYETIPNELSYIVFIVIYYQYLQNTEQTLLLEDYKEEYQIIMGNNPT